MHYIVYKIRFSELCNVPIAAQPFPSKSPPCNDRPHHHVKPVFVFCYMRSRKVSASSPYSYSVPPSLVSKLIPLSGMRW